MLVVHGFDAHLHLTDPSACGERKHSKLWRAKVRMNRQEPAEQTTETVIK